MGFVWLRLACDSCPAALKDEIWLYIQAIWNNLPQADIQNVFESMPHPTETLNATPDGYIKC